MALNQWKLLHRPTVAIYGPLSLRTQTPAWASFTLIFVRNDANDDKCAAQKFKTSSKKNTHNQNRKRKWAKREAGKANLWVPGHYQSVDEMRVFILLFCLCVWRKEKKPLTFKIPENFFEIVYTQQRGTVNLCSICKLTRLSEDQMDNIDNVYDLTLSFSRLCYQEQMFRMFWMDHLPFIVSSNDNIQ